MAQAAESTTTRRDFSKWLVAASVAAAASAPALAAPLETVDWYQLELGLGLTLSHVSYFDEEIKGCEKAIAVWKKRNPWPVALDDAAEQRACESQWVDRYQNALMQTGKGKLGAARLAAYDQYLAECERIANIPARTLAEFKAKIRIARYDHKGGPIHRAILRDVAQLA